MSTIKKRTIQGVAGTSQRYMTKKGKISLINNRFSMNMYEIYCIEGDLFDDVERYDTLNEAEARIDELLI